MSESTTKTLVPKLRFPEFRDAGAWQVKRLGSIATVLQGFGFPTKYQGKTSGKYPFYKVSDISNSLQDGNYLIDKSVNYIDEEDLIALKAKTIPIGTTIFAKIGEAIRSNRRAITTQVCVIDNNTAGIKRILGKANCLFIFNLLSMIDLIEYSGGVVPSVNKSTLENISVLCPLLPEQQKIADCLSILDELIHLHSQKLNALKAHKKGLMQQLFPAEGETVPRLRFPEFRDAGEWQKKKLIDTGKIITGKTPSTKNKDLWGGDILFITPTDIDEGNKYQTSTQRKVTKQKKIKPLSVGSIVYTCIASIGKIAITVHESVTNQQINSIIVNNNFSNEYIYYILVNITPYIKSIPATSTLPIINKTEFSKIAIPLPSLPEQQRIANCLSSLDDLIRLHSQKLAALKAHKKGLMQQLFPSMRGK